MALSQNRFHFIVNPVAGRGRAGKIVPQLRELIDKSGEACDFSVTSEPREATKIAAGSGAEVVVAVGGDGTVNEVVNGIKRKETVLGIVPVGSGNDLARAVNISTDIKEAVATVFNGKPRTVDIGRVNDSLFVNSLAIGIDAAVAKTMNKARWLPSALAYHYGVFSNLFFYENKTIHWKADDHQGVTKANLAAVMNGQTYGGGYQIAPKARPDDGLLDLIIMGDYGIAGRIMHLPKLKKGKHLALPKVNYIQARQIELSSDVALPIAVDGEMLSAFDNETTIKIEVIPGGLQILCRE